MVRVPQAVAVAVLVSGLSPWAHAAPISGAVGWSGSGALETAAEREGAFASLTLSHSPEMDASVFGQRGSGYFSEEYTSASERAVQGATTTAGGEPIALPFAQETRHASLAAAGDSLVLTALSSRLAATPEPASLALLGTGALSAVAMLRRRVR